MKIRKAELADAKGIAKVHVNSWRTTYKGIMPNDALDSLSYEKRTKILTSVLSVKDNKSFIYVAENEAGQIVGFIHGGEIRKKIENYRGELYVIYLLKEHQRKGIGSGLVSSLVKSLLDIKINDMVVWFLAENNARLFYEKLGGVKIKESEETILNQKLTCWAYGWKDLQKAFNVSSD